MLNVKILEIDDWMALYINGKLIDQNHSMSETAVARAIMDQVPDGTYEYREVEDEEFEKWGNTFPDSLD